MLNRLLTTPRRGRASLGSLPLGAVLAFALGAALPLSSASAEDVGPFHIKHWSSGMYIHPEGGSARNDITAVVHPGKGAHTEFLFRPVEGKWGLIIHRQTGKILIPYGGRVDSGNDTRIVFHADSRPGAHFAIDQDKQLIEHRSGRFWHPSGGDSIPEKNTGIVLYNGHHKATHFFAVDTESDRKLSGFGPSVAVAGKAVGDWYPVRTGGTARGKVSMSKSFNIGGSNEKSVSQEVRNAISVTVESGIEFVGGSAGVSVTASNESANIEASTIAETFENGGEVSCEQEIDTETYDYEVMWQWQVRTEAAGTEATIATCTVACTKTGKKPTFLPGSPEQLHSCKIRR